MKNLVNFDKYRDTEMEQLFLPFYFPRRLAGIFRIQLSTSVTAMIVADNGVSSPQWEHVSVSLPNRCLTWQEMCEVKGIFFKPEEAAIQIHPAKQNYVNFHEFCLHIWKPIGFFPLPDLSLYALDQLGKRSTIRLKSGATVTVITDNSFRSSEWKHISVSLQNRFPTWNEMCEVKDKFFKPEEAVIQIHSAERDCVESNGFCLHLWMPIGAFPLPNPCLVY